MPQSFLSRYPFLHLLIVPWLVAAGTTLPAGEIPRPQIPKAVFTITDYGAIGDGKTSNTAAIAKSIDACEKAGGGTVVVPSGRFLTGPITLQSKLELHLASGATLLMSNVFDEYPRDAAGGYASEIVAENGHDIAITGEGTIDGQGAPWWAEFRKSQALPAGTPRMGHRPYLLVLRDCSRVLVQGVTLTNSPSFHLVPQHCQDVVIDHVQFQAPANAPNTDGLDPSGWNYLITHCTFDVGDDCIAIKAKGKSSGSRVSCEDFLITDCVLKHGHGLSIGGQTPGGLRRLTVRDCTFDSTDAGIRMKANRGSGGLVEDCVYENLTMTHVKTPIYITSYYPENQTPKAAADDDAQPIDATTPIWRHIRISHVTAVGSRFAGKIVGLAEMPVSDVTLTDVHISADKGMMIWNARDIRFIGCEVDAAKGPVLETEQASGVTGITSAGKPDDNH